MIFNPLYNKTKILNKNYQIQQNKWMIMSLNKKATKKNKINLNLK